MVDDILVTKAFMQALNKYPDQNSVKKTIQLLTMNPAHPSLNVHRYRGVKKGILECYINSGDRILFEVTKNALHLWYLGHHSMLDRAHQFNFTANKSFAQFVITPQTTDKSEIEVVTEPSKEYNSIASTWRILELEDEVVISESELVEAPTAMELFTEFVVKEDTNQNCFSSFEDFHLRILGVPSELVQGVKDASSIDEVFALPGLPRDVYKRLLEAYTSPNITISMFDKSLLVYRTTLENFEGYCGGKIRQLMLNLYPDQQQYVEMEDEPLILIKGAAGSGKTAIGIYRAIRLAKQKRRVLVLTFTRMLSNSTQALIERLLETQPHQNLQVVTLHSWITKFIRRYSNNVTILRVKECEVLLANALKEVVGERRCLFNFKARQGIFSRRNKICHQRARYKQF